MQAHGVTIYHNPDCGSSRNTLALIRNAGIEPTIIHYLQTPATAAELATLIAAMGVTVRDVMRTNVAPYADLGLAADHFTDEQLLDYMASHPILMNRPIVVTAKGVRLCRPPELVLDLLPLPQRGDLPVKDGQACDWTR